MIRNWLINFNMIIAPAFATNKGKFSIKILCGFATFWQHALNHRQNYLQQKNLSGLILAQLIKLIYLRFCKIRSNFFSMDGEANQLPNH